MFAGDIRRQRVSAMRGFRHWRWHLDEVFVKINGETHYLWRAVDHDDEVLESYVTRTRDKDVVDAYDGEHAFVGLAVRPDIGAVFTDVNMPGRFNGVQLARMVNERRPDVVILVTSGAIKVQRTDAPDGGQFIPKPYRGENVAKLIEELVGAAA